MSQLSQTNQDFLLTLERERLDTSWRTPKFDRYAPKEPAKARKQGLKSEVTKQRRNRDRIMFHAGRYAAGARDEEAINANKQLPTLINVRKP